MVNYNDKRAFCHPDNIAVGRNSQRFSGRLGGKPGEGRKNRRKELQNRVDFVEG